MGQQDGAGLEHSDKLRQARLRESGQELVLALGDLQLHHCVIVHLVALHTYAFVRPVASIPVARNLRST